MMEFYRAEILIEHTKNYSEKESNERKKAEEEQQDQTKYSPSTMMKEAKRSLPNMSSSFGSFKPPSFKF